MEYVVVQTTPEQDRFKAGTRKTYAAIPRSQYDRENDKWRDRIYCGVLPEDHAKALAKHLNKNSNTTFRWKPRVKP